MVTLGWVNVERYASIPPILWVPYGYRSLAIDRATFRVCTSKCHVTVNTIPEETILFRYRYVTITGIPRAIYKQNRKRIFPTDE